MRLEEFRASLMAGPYKMTVSDVDRFVIKLDMRGEDECWEWLGTRDLRGYGKFKLRGEMPLAHRLASGIIGPLHGCHRCDFPGCCNPNHIFPGTPADNRADSVSKGRHEHGERHRCAKLTDNSVRVIRNRYAAGGVTLAELGNEYSVRPQVIHQAIKRKTWKHVA